MEPSTSLCQKCQLISSEFILSRDFRDFRPFSDARTAAPFWTCREDEKGKRYREIPFHDMDGLSDASRKGCRICSFFLALLGRFSINGRFPLVSGQFRVAVSETGGLELVPPSDWTWGDLNLGWQEVRGDAGQSVPVQDGQMRPIAQFTSNKSQELQKLALEVIRPWLQQCEAGHPCDCGGLKHFEHRKSRTTVPAEAELPILPTRVIDVGLEGDSARLHISQPGERGRYLTLSYRWGEGNEAAMTTAHNVFARTQRIEVADLPNTIKDAIEVTRAIGVAFVWIDAVCIIQATSGGADGKAPDPGDFHDEAHKMSAYYGNSYCTIAATAAASTAQGFLRPRTTDAFADSCTLSPWLLPGGRRRTVRVGSGLPRWKADVQSAAMYRRAWVLQERALSSRVLHWGRGALWWECAHQRAAEFLPRDAVSDSADQAQPYMRPARWLAESAAAPAGLWRSWVDLVREYSAMDLGRESDRLVALQGLVDVVAQRFRGETYLFGAWVAHLPAALCWAVSKRRAGGGGGGGGGPAVPCDAPSWSWAACAHPVIYMYPPTHPRSELVGYDDGAGTGFRCRLRVRGLLEKAPFGGRKIVREEPPTRGWFGTKNYNLTFDECPLECPSMANVDVFLVATFDWERQKEDRCATQFLLLEPVEAHPSHYRRIGHAMRWTRTKDWKALKSEEVEIYLV